MTPIEKLRKWADCAWDAPDELRLLLAAYDARGEEIKAWRAAYEAWRPGVCMRDCSDHATDSAVARVEGER